MARINLLPWRQEERKEKQRQFLTLMGLSAFMMVMILVAVHLQYGRMLSAQNSRNSYLETHISDVEKELKEIQDLEKEKSRLLARMKIIQQLQQNRPEIVRMFDEIVRTIPEGVHLKLLAQSGRSLKLEGFAQSNARVSSFMRNIDAAKSLANPTLQIIETDKKSEDKARAFILSAQQVTQESEQKSDKKKKPRKRN